MAILEAMEQVITNSEALFPVSGRSLLQYNRIKMLKLKLKEALNMEQMEL